MFKVLTESPLSAACPTPCRGLAFDGCWLYLTRECACSVCRIDRCGQLQACFETCRCYTAICFDWKEDCFWAACDRRPEVLFKLDRCFREIDCLELRVCGLGRVTGLSFQCCADGLLAAFAGGIALMDKTGRILWERRASCWTQGALSLCPYAAVWSFEKGETVVRLLDREHKPAGSCRIPCGICLEAAVLDPCGEECGCAVYALVTKRGRYPYLLRCALEDGCVCRALCPCSRQLCRCEPPCEKPCACDACADAMESIALMEAALSHILNAEGEKLQKVIASTDDPCRLLEVNQAVNATLVNATHLEHVLFHKLELLRETCGFCRPDGCAEPEER